MVETADQTFRPDLEGSFRQLQEAGLDFTYGKTTMDYDGERLPSLGRSAGAAPASWRFTCGMDWNIWALTPSARIGKTAVGWRRRTR